MFVSSFHQNNMSHEEYGRKGTHKRKPRHSPRLEEKISILPHGDISITRIRLPIVLRSRVSETVWDYHDISVNID